MKYLAVDPGEARVGLAVSDKDGRIALPLGVIHERDPDKQMRRVAEAAEAEQVDAVVVGVPYTLRGERGPAAQSILKQVEALTKMTSKPVLTHDERMTTSIAENVLLDADVSRRGRKKHIDKMAATVILQSFLRKINNEEESGQC